MNLKRLLFLLILFTSTYVFGQKGDIIVIKNPVIDSVLAPKYSTRNTVTYLVNESHVKYQGGIHFPKNKTLHPKIETFKILAPYFAKDEDGIFFDGDFVKVDTTGFKFFGQSTATRNFIWKTNGGVFVNKHKVNDVDAINFNYAQGYLNSTGYIGWYTDQKYVYFYDKRLDSVDVDTFFSLDNTIGFDKNGMYKYGDPILLEGEKIKFLNQRLQKTSKDVIIYLDVGLSAIKTKIDINSVEALSRYYSKDKDFIYYMEIPLPIPKERFGSVKIWDKYNSSYISDGIDLYFQNKKITEMGFDIRTFGMFMTTDYVYDKNGIYNKEWDRKKDGYPLYTKLPFKYSSPVTLQNTFRTSYYIIYQNQAYSSLDNKVFNNITPVLVKALMGNKRILFEEDGKIYHRNNYEHDLFEANGKIWFDNGKSLLVTTADTKTFETIANYSQYYKDKNMVYKFSWQYGLQEIPEIDANSVTIRNNLLADKNYVYYENIKLVKNEDLEFLAFSDGYSMRPSQYLFRNSEGYWISEVYNKEAKIKFLGKDEPEEIKIFLNSNIF
ncbi:DKNYY domain-containing protein [Chryseobacterium chendengshani]|uniref:DKNYY domain-containing protein n=1 Tax=Chryseobacterium sp. LJ756 TaxID=2864113 RepID=UPI001C6448F8|nr:DKNYY domain-containing protein [Chryseobacterium sp. LJ756]MBW7674215.1 DKNYY domain-containing protein [Chryseobacterium sp. LJ756]